MSEASKPEATWAEICEEAGSGDFLKDYILQGDPYATGLWQLDGILGGGLYPGVTTIGGEPGSFKTGFACALMVNWAAGGMRPVYFSLELSRQDILMRMCSYYATTRSDLSNFRWATAHPSERPSRRDGRSEHEWAMDYERKMRDADPTLVAWSAMREEIGGRYAVFEDVHKLGSITQVIRQLGECGLRSPVVIDYAQLIETDNMGASEYERMSLISRELATAAKIGGVPVLLISSLKKLSEKDRLEGPSVNWFRGSGYLGYDATAAVIIGEPETIDEKYGISESEWHVVKNRHGSVTSVLMQFQPWCGWVKR